MDAARIAGRAQTTTGSHAAVHLGRADQARLDRLLTYVLNGEIKSVSALLLRDDPQSMEQLRERFLETTNETWIPKNLTGHLRRYVGLMAEAGFAESGKDADLECRGYRISHNGAHYAQPLAFFALEVTDRYNISMYEVLGQAGSSGESRAPLNRVKIFARLAQCEAQMTDLIEITGVNNVIGHVKKLSTIGLVEYDSIERDLSWSGYRWVKGKDPEEVGNFHRYNGRVKEVARHLCKVGEGNRLTISDYLVTSGLRHGNPKFAMYTASEILQHLRRWGFVEAKNDLTTHRKSHVRLTEKGREFYNMFVVPVVRAVTNRGELEEISRWMNIRMQDQDWFRALATNSMKRYVAASPQANRPEPGAQMSKIYAYVQEKTTVRAKEIINTFGRGAYDYLAGMVENGWLAKDETGTRVDYRLSGTPPLALRTAQ